MTLQPGQIWAQVHAFPTWFFFRVMRRFLRKDHPWRQRKFSLREWSRGETDLCGQFDTMFWIMGIAFTAASIRLWSLL